MAGTLHLLLDDLRKPSSFHCKFVSVVPATAGYAESYACQHKRGHECHSKAAQGRNQAVHFCAQFG